MTRTKFSLVLGVVCAVSLACGQEESTPAPESEAPAEVGAFTTPKPVETAPFDVNEVMRRVHFSYRLEEGRWTGGHTTYGVEVDGARIRYKPVHYEALTRPPDEPPVGPPQRRPPKVGAPFELETVAIDRGGNRSLPGTEIEVAEDGHLIRGGGEVTEELRNRDEGVEVSWAFPTAPSGRGDLVVRVRATGYDYVVSNDSGLHFRDPVTTLGVRYGHATWIDADGRRTPVAARWNGGEIVMRVPGDAIDRSAYPAVLDPVIGPETAVDASVSGPASGGQDQVSVAYSATASTYFLAWNDYRTESYAQIFGTRVNSSGTVLDANGIKLDTATSYAYSASVVFDGTNFLVVYETAGDVWGRRFTTAGVAVDATAFNITGMMTNSQYGPFAYNNGTTTFVAFQDYRDSATEGVNLYGTTVTGSTINFPSGIKITGAANTQYNARVTYGGGNWFICWEDYRSGSQSDIYCQRVSSGGVALDPVATNIAVSNSGQYEQWPWVASNGTDYFVVWADARNTNYDIYGARVTSAGVVSDTAGIQINNLGNYEYYPSVAFNGGNYQVVWEDYRGPGLYGNRVAPGTGALLDGATGMRIDPATTPITHSPRQPRIFATGSNFYVGWVNYPGDVGYSDLLGSRMTASPPATQDSGGVNITNSGNGQRNLDIATDGISRWMVVWEDDRGGSRSIYGVRVNSSGTPMDATGILLSSGGSSESNPSVAYNGTHFLAVWQDYRGPSGLWGVRINPATGALVDASSLQLYTSGGVQPYEPDVASDGTNWYIVWQDWRISPSQIYGGRVSAAGAPMDAAGGVIVSSGTGSQYKYSPSVAYGGSYYLSCWADYRSGTSYDVYCARTNTSGVVQDTSGIGVATGPGWVDSGAYDIAYLSPNFWIVYGENSQIYRARIASATGALVDANISVAACCRYRPSIAHDGDLFYVVYSQSASLGYDVRGTRLDNTGADLDSTDWDISVGQGANYRGPTVRTIPDVGLVGYTRYDSTTGVTSDRIRTRTLGRVANGGACTIGLDCISTFCSDGVCCNSACGGTTSGDCQACSTAAGASANGTCTTLPTTYTCRAASGTCDVAENCSGTSTSCPADGYAAATVTCRASAGVCDPAENCTGTSASCPSDTLSPATTECRAAADVCDVAENCTGTSATCPANALRPATFVCRAAAAGGCDIAENCTGTSATCPTDALAPATTVCRAAAAGGCDVAENCTGTSATCPTDAFSPTTTVCRASAGVCDPAENCPGTSATCPSNAFSPSTTVCRAAVAGGCDVAENCTGTSAACPTDVVQPATTVCRASVGTCDVAENCTGTANTCPADTLRPSSFVCRAAADLCDAAENCTGTSATCPADALATAGTVCRGAAGGCDIAETCSGASVSCPTDVLRPSTFECRPAVAGGCDLAENCTGTSATCPSDAVVTAGTVCRASAGVCDVAESCTGSSASCPTNAFLDSTTTCRASAGVCDSAEVCSGSSATCPANSFEPSTTSCRAAVDDCDAEEFCTGTSASCPANAVLPSSTICRLAAGMCDVAENCTGTSTACPVDTLVSAGTVCRAAAGGCDVDEACTGSSAACPTDALASAGTVCRAAVSDCDAEETCSGSSTACPADALRPDGSSCADGDPCTAGETCTTGTCGNGVPSLAFDPSSITFTPTFTGQTSAPTTVDLTNNGEADLMITTISTTTSDFTTSPAPPFTVTTGGGTGTMDVVFAPMSTIGTISDTVTVATNSCTFDLPVQGESRSAELTITPSDGDFGDISVGTFVDRNYVVENTGSTLITVSDIDVDLRDHFSLTLVNPTNLPAMLDPGDTVVLTVRAEPMTSGPVTDTMVIDYTPTGGSLITVNFSLTANGTTVDAGPPDASQEPDAGDIDAGGPGLDDSYYTCECRAGARSSNGSPFGALVPLAGIALVIALRRRRRR